MKDNFMVEVSIAYFNSIVMIYKCIKNDRFKKPQEYYYENKQKLGPKFLFQLLCTSTDVLFPSKTR